LMRDPDKEERHFDMRKTLTAAFAVLTATLAGMAGAVALATSPSQATGSAPIVCGTWKMRGATGTYPAITFGGAPAGSSVHRFSAVLKKPTTGVDPGVEFAAKDLKVTTTGQIQVRVDYLLNGASHTSGAIRLFGYQEKNADTLLSAPDWSDVASANMGTLVLTVPAGTNIGTLGLVYDASNSGAGSVTFSAMRIGTKVVRFTTCPVPASPSASASASASASVSASASASASASVSASASASASASTSASPSASATTRPSVNPSSSSPRPSPSASSEVPVPGGGDQTPVAGNLPLTGPGGGPGKLFLLAGLGIVMVMSGIGALVIVRRRQTGDAA